MVEAQVRALLEQLATSDAPPSRIDIGLARRQGRSRLRWHRVGFSAAALLTVAAVATLALTGPASPGDGPAVLASGPVVAPRQFSPLIPYPSLHWLPSGAQVVATLTGRTETELLAGADGHAIWDLSVYAAGRCHLLSSAGPGGGQALNCVTNPRLAQEPRITGTAPAVHGHLAYWAGDSLVWRYARSGWTILTELPRPGQARVVKPDQLKLIRIAAGVRYGTTRTPGVFAAQLTDVPAAWQPGAVFYEPRRGVLFGLETEIDQHAADIFAGKAYEPPGLPVVSVLPAPANAGCRATADGRSRVISGHRVVIYHRTGSRGLPEQELCVNLDRLTVVISETGRHPALGVIAIFAHHLHVLGASPADWSPSPIG